MVDKEWRINILEDIYGSQKDLAESLGVSSRTIRYWKSGESTPSSSNMSKINRRWQYFKKRVGLYHYQELKVTDPDTGESTIINNRTDQGELDKDVHEDLLDEQQDTIQGIQESLEAKGYTQVEILKDEIRLSPFRGNESMNVIKNNNNFFPKDLR